MATSKDAACALTQWSPSTAREQSEYAAAHPVSRRDYTLPTPPLESASNLALARVTNGAQCCGFVGRPRFGKTTAAIYIAADIREHVPNTYVIQLICRQDNRRSEGALCDWFDQITGGPSHRPRQEDPVFALSRRWLAEALSAHAQRIAFVIDEIGRLSEQQLTILADLQNQIAMEHVRVTFLVFGSVEVVALKNSLLQTDRADLIGRFLSRLHSFDGIKTKAQLKTVMEAFDDAEIADYPRGSGCAFSQFFLPQVFASGWRLGECADQLWDEFKVVSPKREIELGAEYVFAAIEYFLKRSMTVQNRHADMQWWRAAVLESGYQDSMYAVASKTK